MRDLHSVLRRQIARHIGGDPESLPPQWRALLEAVNEAYHQADEDRALLERTMDLSSQEMMQINAELRRTKDEAQAASRTKSEFLSNMRHELRTPLNAILGFADLLVDFLEGKGHAQQREFAQNIVDSGRSLLVLITDLLDLAKLEAGRLELTRFPVDVAAALHEAARAMQPSATERGVSIEIKLGAPPPRADADEGRLRQILRNLLSNAVKFTPPGGSICLSARAGSGENATVEISVADTGIGIAPEDQERIFGRFEQIDPSATRSYQGTGLGLSLTRKLVELHGGILRVESQVGKGSTFTFLLPAIRAAANPGAGPSEVQAE